MEIAERKDRRFTEPGRRGKETSTRDESRDGCQVIPRAEGRTRSFHSSNYQVIIRISRSRVNFMRFCDARSTSL